MGLVYFKWTCLNSDPPRCKYGFPSSSLFFAKHRRMKIIHIKLIIGITTFILSKLGQLKHLAINLLFPSSSNLMHSNDFLSLIILMQHIDLCWENILGMQWLLQKHPMKSVLLPWIQKFFKKKNLNSFSSQFTVTLSLFFKIKNRQNTTLWIVGYDCPRIPTFHHN